MSDPKHWLRTLDVGPCVAGIQVSWSWDWWQWTSKNGDVHEDLFAVSVVNRAGQPRMLRLTSGPLSVMALMDRTSLSVKRPRI